MRSKEIETFLLLHPVALLWKLRQAEDLSRQREET